MSIMNDVKTFVPSIAGCVVGICSEFLINSLVEAAVDTDDFGVLGNIAIQVGAFGLSMAAYGLVSNYVEKNIDDTLTLGEKIRDNVKNGLETIKLEKATSEVEALA